MGCTSCGSWYAKEWGKPETLKVTELRILGNRRTTKVASLKKDVTEAAHELLLGPLAIHTSGPLCLTLCSLQLSFESGILDEQRMTFV